MHYVMFVAKTTAAGERKTLNEKKNTRVERQCLLRRSRGFFRVRVKSHRDRIPPEDLGSSHGFCFQTRARCAWDFEVNLIVKRRDVFRRTAVIVQLILPDKSLDLLEIIDLVGGWKFATRLGRRSAKVRSRHSWWLAFNFLDLSWSSLRWIMFFVNMSICNSTGVDLLIFWSFPSTVYLWILKLLESLSLSVSRSVYTLLIKLFVALFTDE